MQKHIVINTSICANAQDVASSMKSEFGLEIVNFSTEFLIFTGDNENSYSANLDIKSYHALARKVIRKIRLRLLKPSVILVNSNSLSNITLSELGFVYNLEKNEYNSQEIAELIFENAVEHYCSPQEKLSLVA